MRLLSGFLGALLATGCAAVMGLAPASAASRALDVQIQQTNGSKTPVRLYSSSYALVVGIDDYSGGWPRLSNAVRDARAVGKALERHGFEVTLRTNLGRADLVAAMREFFIVKGSDPDARLLLWFAGHGHTENNEGFLIPADGAVPEAGHRFRLTALPMRDVSTFVRLAQSKHVLSIFDSCFAGTVFDASRAAAPRAITRAVTQPVRQFLTSGDAYQQVSDDGSFQELFVRALDGGENADLNNDGFITGTELGFYITDRVTNLTQGRQTPRYGKLRDRNFDRGDYVFAAFQPDLPTATAEVPAGAGANSQAIEVTFWQSAERTNTAISYREYLTYFPTGMFAGLANEKIRLLNGKSPAAKVPDTSKKATGPSTSNEEKKAQLAFWQFARNVNTLGGFEHFLSEYPDSPYANVAREQIATLNQRNRALQNKVVPGVKNFTGNWRGVWIDNKGRSYKNATAEFDISSVGKESASGRYRWGASSTQRGGSKDFVGHLVGYSTGKPGKALVIEFDSGEKIHLFLQSSGDIQATLFKGKSRYNARLIRR